MTTAKPLPPHGTYGRANGRPRAGIKPCPCGPCYDEAKKYRKRRRHLTATGRSLTVDAAPVAAHLRMLLDTGEDLLSISRRIDYTYGPLKKVADGVQKKLQRVHADQILALRPVGPAGLYVSPVGSMRRIRALYAIGHSQRDVVEEAGVSKAVLSALTGGHRTCIARQTAEAITAAYRRLCMVPGTSPRTAAFATRKEWAPPLAWTDIDDPDEVPAGWKRSGKIRAEDLAEDIEFIIRTTGVSLDLVAERLGEKRNKLEKARERTAARARAGAV